MKPRAHQRFYLFPYLGLVLASIATAQAAEVTNSAGSLSLDQQIEAMARYALPGREHQVLTRMAGTWEAVTRYWMRPDVEPAESKGTSTRKWILDGRFLMEELDGGNLALPFRGVGLFGYDAFEKKYSSAWADTTSTAILTNLGFFDKTNNVVNFTGEYKDPWTGTRKKSRGLVRFVGPDRQVLELHVTEASGREFLMLEITYTRKEAGRSP